MRAYASSPRRSTPPRADAVISAESLVKTYRMGEVNVPALRGVSLELLAGEMLVLLGASGSGKSTLLNILGGLDVPTSGTVRYGDTDLTGADDRTLTEYRRNHVGFVFQFYNLIPSLTARENVELVTDIAANPMAYDEALRIVGLGERMDHFPAQLSGGEQQRVAIARALAKKPKLIFADEPTSALDGENGHVVMELLRKCAKEQGSTVLCVTHDARLARFADRIITIEDGRIVGDDRSPGKTHPPPGGTPPKRKNAVA